MKKFGYLLMMLMLLSGLSLSAQNYGKPYRPQYGRQQTVSGVYQQMPNAGMRSTSTFSSSGSALPQAAVTGTFTADEAASPAHIGAIRRSVGGGGFADDDDVEEDKDNKDPDIPGEPQPIGDAVLPLLLMALAFGGVIFLRKRRALPRVRVRD